ncbi:hypothetical protein [Bacillus sinesaloumensis]|uniref:hypothetical protein n=1 Tax=Litchfieldia sinesaloumensis TaxID=1926280 RepID=UPI0009885B02|nr:hypothetical protein [Bacillus sinesaloumensis]
MQLVPDKFRELRLHFRFNVFDTESLRTFFVTFRLKCYFLLLLSPFGLGASAYLAQVSVGVGSIGVSIGLFVLSLLLLLPWTLVPIALLFTTFQAQTWQRKLSWVYIGLLITAYIYWIIIL